MSVKFNVDFCAVILLYGTYRMKLRVDQWVVSKKERKGKKKGVGEDCLLV